MNSSDAAAPRILPDPVAAGEAASSQARAPQGPSVTATIPDGCTLLVDGGALPSAGRGRKSANKRLLLLATPRIVIAEEEETAIGPDRGIDLPSRPKR